MSRRILFVLASPEYLRYFDTTMALLAQRGNHVAVAVNWLREKKHARLETLIADPRIEIAGQLPARADLWLHTARAVRGTFDFVRYLHPSLAHATALRQRARRKAAPRIVSALDRVRTLSPGALRRLYGVLRAIESAVPVSATLVAYLRERRPDLVVVSPLVDLVSSQVDTVRAAQALGIPVALAVASWDNLTNKGHLRVVPDVVTVWNARQEEEASTLHGIPRDRVTVTGAQLFDRWFEREPSQTRASYCATVGLADERPFVLYTGSSIFIARSEFEVPFVRRWLTALRQDGPRELRDVNVVIRPHPFNSEAWETADMSDLGPVTIWPKARYTPASETSRNGFFDSLYYCAAVVGINTSAMIEAAILRKPVLSLLTPEFARTQEETVHFHYLLPENGGFLRVASDVKRHLEQLAEVLLAPDVSRSELEHFVASFLRPHGVGESATPRLVAALEGAAVAPAAQAVRAHRDGVGVVALRWALFPLACLVALFSPPVTSEGKLADGWFKRTHPIRKLKKHLMTTPARRLERTAQRVSKEGAKLVRTGRRRVASLLGRPQRKKAKHEETAAP